MDATAAIMSAVSLLVSLGSFLLSFHIWKRSHRPIVTAAVKTHAKGNKSMEYDLVISNSGMIPAKGIQIEADNNLLAAAFGLDASAEHKERWLAPFNRKILILRKNDQVSCSFGFTMADSSGFWKYNATIPIEITYKDWFGTRYNEKQEIQIADSESFTGYAWGSPTGEIK